MTTNKTALVFPGQGSQSVGMMNEFSDYFPLIKDTFNQASHVLGFDLWDMVQHGPEEDLNKTVNTQPALLVAGFALWKIYQEKKLDVPTFLAGHSLGEYTALLCAGAIDFNDAVRLVKNRGEFMQAAVKEGEGAMAALIGLDPETVTEICNSLNDYVVPANYNAIGQIVIAGKTNAVEEAIKIAKENGAKLAKLLPVSVPSHCELMKPASEKLKDLLSKMTFHPPSIPVVNNAEVVCPNDPAEIKNALVKQLFMPVRWVETIQMLSQEGVQNIIECGPGKVLTGLCKRIDKKINAKIIGEIF